MIEYARRNPGRVTYGSAGVGSTNHLAGEWLSRLARVSLIHIPYKGDTPAVSDLVGGRLDVYFMTPQRRDAAGPGWKDQGARSRVLCADAPDGGCEDRYLVGSAAVRDGKLDRLGRPGGNAPPEAVERINRAINDALKEPRARGMLFVQGQEPVPVTPKQVAQRIGAELKQWEGVAKERGSPSNKAGAPAAAWGA